MSAGVPTELYTTPWFIAAFSNTFPIETRLRVWDIFLLEGISAIHQARMPLPSSGESYRLVSTSAPNAHARYDPPADRGALLDGTGTSSYLVPPT